MIKIEKKYYYYLILIKENFVYLLTNLLALTLIIFISVFNLQKIKESQEKIRQLNQEKDKLLLKQKNIDYFKKNFSDLNINPQEAIKILNQLVPEEEDYFSILYALETLSKKTGFQITAYSINLSSSNNERLNLTVKGNGDVNTFLNFLKEYNVGGGRLITANNLALNPQQAAGFKIDLTFYHKKNINVDNKDLNLISINTDLIKKIKEIFEKTEIILKKSSSETTINTNYSRKSDPFSLK